MGPASFQAIEIAERWSRRFVVVMKLRRPSHAENCHASGGREAPHRGEDGSASPPLTGDAPVSLEQSAAGWATSVHRSARAYRLARRACRVIPGSMLHFSLARYHVPGLLLHVLPCSRLLLAPI